MNKTRVLVVDDSSFFRTFLINNLSSYPHIEIVGFAANAMEAKDLILKLKPDVMTLDVEMPGMSGIDLLKQLGQTSSARVVLVSAVNMNVFDALSAGAVDFVKKPDSAMPDSGKRFIQDLAGKIAIAQRAKVGHKPTASALPATTSLALKSSPASKSILIALGASTGGTEATLAVMKDLPANTPGMVIVQHMPPGFTKMYADRLNNLCPMEVREAKNGDQIRQGLALIAPGDMQMQVVSAGSSYSVKCFHGEKVSGHCPSVDMLFHSVASSAGGKAVGIILTGMGKDGAEGLLAMRKKGAYTIGQDEASCVVYGMPMVAYNIGAVVKQSALNNIAYVLKGHLNQL